MCYVAPFRVNRPGYVCLYQATTSTEVSCLLLFTTCLLGGVRVWTSNALNAAPDDDPELFHADSLVLYAVHNNLLPPNSPLLAQLRLNAGCVALTH